MTASKPGLGSDLTRVDAREPSVSDYSDIPELTGEWFAGAQVHEAGKPVRRGRPKAASPKQAVNLRLSQKVLTGFREDGPGWQTRINTALEQWLDERKGRG